MRPIDNLRQSAINLTTKLLFVLQLAAAAEVKREAIFI